MLYFNSILIEDEHHFYKCQVIAYMLVLGILSHAYVYRAISKFTYWYVTVAVVKLLICIYVLCVLVKISAMEGLEGNIWKRYGGLDTAGSSQLCNGLTVSTAEAISEATEDFGKIHLRKGKTMNVIKEWGRKKKKKKWETALQLQGGEGCAPDTRAEISLHPME